MKHMKKILISAAAAALLSVSVLTGCGGGGAPDSIEGTTWVLVQAEYGGTDYTSMLNSIGGITVNFEDGRSMVTYMGQTSGGTYSYNNGSVTLSGGTATIDGNKMYFNVDGIECIMERR